MQNICKHAHTVPEDCPHCAAEAGAEGAQKRPLRRSHFAWGIFGQVLRFFGWMAGFGGLVATTTCPFCGQTGCPVGAGTTGIIGGLFALCMTNWKLLTSRIKGVMHKGVPS